MNSKSLTNIYTDLYTSKREKNQILDEADKEKHSEESQGTSKTF